MKNAMSPMLEEMKNAEPSLFTKATGIANGILSRLKKAFDIHSPSRKTRQIMKFAMQPMEEEMEDGKKELFKQADEIGEGVVDRLSNINGNVNVNGNMDIDKRHYDGGFDYQKMADAFLSALNKCKLTLDEDSFVKLVRNELYEVI